MAIAGFAAKDTKVQNTPPGLTKDDRPRNKDLQKTKLCVYFVQGKCGLGTSCQFAHCASEIRKAPNLTKTALCTNFMNGNCKNPNCTYAHGEAELVKPPSFKKKMCVWFTQGKCRNGRNCGFVHDSSELQGESVLPEEFESFVKKAPPWKSGGYALDCDASTVAPPSGSSQTGSTRSQMETDGEGPMMSTKPIPDEHLFRMVAGRGSAPLKQQVSQMGLAIGELQAKLSQMQGRQQAAASNVVEGDTGSQKQVDEMQSVIDQLSKQCQGMEVGMQLSDLRTKTQAPPSMSAPLTMMRPGASMRQARGPGQTLGPEDLTRTIQLGPLGKPAPPPRAEKARPAQSSYVKPLSRNSFEQKARSDLRPATQVVKPSAKVAAKHALPFEMRAALGVLIVSMMVVAELVLR